MTGTGRALADARTFLYCRGWSEAKPGQDGEENQDAFLTRLVPDAVGATMLVTVSDGATSTVFAGEWARTLVAAAEPDWPDLDDDTLTARLDAVREQFQLTLPADLVWYMTAKLAKEGSQATLTAASFTPSTGGQIHCRVVAVGDSPMIIFRPDGSADAFPLASSADFTSSPQLVSTKPQPDLHYERWDPILMPGDVVVGCTDAVGKWALEGAESADRASLFRLLLDLMADDGSTAPGAAAGVGLSPRIARIAAQRQLDEDDATLVLCVPLPPRSAGTPPDFARKVLQAHLTGDFGSLSAPEAAGITAVWSTGLSWVRRVVRTVLG